MFINALNTLASQNIKLLTLKENWFHNQAKCQVKAQQHLAEANFSLSSQMMIQKAITSRWCLSACKCWNDQPQVYSLWIALLTHTNLISYLLKCTFLWNLTHLNFTVHVLISCQVLWTACRADLSVCPARMLSDWDMKAHVSVSHLWFLVAPPFPVMPCLLHALPSGPLLSGSPLLAAKWSPWRSSCRRVTPCPHPL